MCIDALKANSDKFKVFCLVHKMDLVPADIRASVFAKQVHVQLSMLSANGPDPFSMEGGRSETVAHGPRGGNFAFVIHMW